MQYMLMNYVREDGWTRLTGVEQAEGIAAYMAYSEALRKAGVLKGSHSLQPSSTATTVRIADGKPQVLDGPSRTPKSSSVATSSSRWPTSTPLLRGRRDARR